MGLSESVDVDDGFGEGLRRFLRQIVSDAACDEPMLVFAGEFRAVGGHLRMRRAIGIAFHGDRGHGDDRTLGEPLFQRVPFALTVSELRLPLCVGAETYVSGDCFSCRLSPALVASPEPMISFTVSPCVATTEFAFTVTVAAS